MPARRPCVLPALLGAGAFAYFWSSNTFVAYQSSSRALGRTAMQGFKEDFDQWRGTLTPEERSMVANQAKGAYNKKFRSTDEFKKELPDEKVKAFGEVLAKFFDAELEDSMKEERERMDAGDPDGILFKGKTREFEMKSRIIEWNCDSERRYFWAQEKHKEAKAKGEKFFSASPKLDKYDLKNDDEASHNFNVALHKDLSKLDATKMKDIEVPPMGERFILSLPMAVVNILKTSRESEKGHLAAYWAASVQAWNMYGEDAMKNGTEPSMDEFHKVFGTYSELAMNMASFTALEWNKAKDEVEALVNQAKSQAMNEVVQEMKDKTQKDVMLRLRDFFEFLPGVSPPPKMYDEKYLAELAKVPAVSEQGDWPASLLYKSETIPKQWKSEAVDAWGNRYLLGIFETQEEASKGFDEWFTEYQKAQDEKKEELKQLSKKEQARLDADIVGQDNMKAVFETINKKKAVLEKEEMAEEVTVKQQIDKNRAEGINQDPME